MKTKKILIIIISSIILIIVVSWGALEYHWNTAQEPLCNSEGNTGWAPLGPNGGPIGCDGKRLNEDSPLIDRSRDFSGYTCYCHTPNTCWNGRDCVQIKR